MQKIRMEELEEFRIGHAQNEQAMTGCTVILCENGATTGVDVRGGSPGTRETDLLASENNVEKAHATFLSGGSAFGLDVGAGIMKFLEERDKGFDVGNVKVPIVPGAILFDLGIGDAAIRPDKEMGYNACLHAYKEQTGLGNIGAGTGATIGKVLGPDYMMKGGIGFAGYQIGALQISAVVAVNAVGDVYNPIKNKQIAGVYDRKENVLLNSADIILSQITNNKHLTPNNGNTTIGTIMTNAKLSKAQANKIASISQDGIAKTINPSHTLMDGDTLFMMSTGKVEIDPNIIGILATTVVSEAIIEGITQAKRFDDIPSFQDI